MASDGTLIVDPATGTCNVPDGVNLEGYFTSIDQMALVANCLVGPVDQWIDVAGMSHPNHYFYVPLGVHGGEEGTDRPWCEFDAESMMYCPSDGSVYMGEQFLWDVYSQQGDLAPLIALAHEVGHRFQHVQGLNTPDPDIPTESIPMENQADCVSGVFIDYLDRGGALTVGDDLQDIAATLILAGGMAEPLAASERNHGDIDQRTRAFYTGFNRGWAEGIAACNEYVTDVQLVPTDGATSTPAEETTTTTTTMTGRRRRPSRRPRPRRRRRRVRLRSSSVRPTSRRAPCSPRSTVRPWPPPASM